MTETTPSSLLSKLKAQLAEAKIERREFIRTAALLGVSVAAAQAMTGVATSARAAETSTLPFPPSDPAAKSGGVLRIGQRVAKMDDPALYSWNEMSNQSRPVIEHMTLLGTDNIVRPMLIEAWEPAEDLKSWVLKVRKGVLWHNGEELTAEHIAWNIRRWTDSSLGSANIGLSTFDAMSVETGAKDAKGKAVRVPVPGAIEVVDKHTLKLNLSRPVLAVPQDCAEYPTLIVHPSFKTPFSAAPIGTGPFTVAELKVGDRCILKRVSKTADGKDFKYWGGQVYLDEIHYYHFDQENQPAALASKTVDAIYELTIDQIELGRSIPNATVASVPSSATLCCRMQVDAKPFDDIRVRRAVVKAADNVAIQELTFSEGATAYNYHVSPIHPEYFELPPLKRDVKGAKALLAEAGYPNGLSISIDVGNTDGPWHQAVCEALRDQLAEAGIKLAVNVLPTTRFWETWMATPFGATSWAHRPLGTMTLGLAYRSGVPWNESHFSDPEFDKALSDAEATIDVAQRRAKMQRVEQILLDAAVMIQPLWRPFYTLSANNVHAYLPHPARQMHLVKVWMG